MENPTGKTDTVFDFKKKQKPKKSKKKVKTSLFFLSFFLSFSLALSLFFFFQKKTSNLKPWVSRRKERVFDFLSHWPSVHLMKDGDGDGWMEMEDLMEKIDEVGEIEETFEVEEIEEI